MIEYINLLLLLTMFGSTCYVYYRLKKIFYLISIVMDSEILDQLTNLERDVDSEFPKQELSTDLESNPFLNTAPQRFTCDLYYRFGALLAPVSVGIITGKHYAKNSITKLNDRSNSGTCDPATRNCNQTEEPSEN